MDDGQAKAQNDKIAKEMEQSEEKLFGIQINTSRNQQLLNQTLLTSRAKHSLLQNNFQQKVKIAKEIKNSNEVAGNEIIKGIKV